MLTYMKSTTYLNLNLSIKLPIAPARKNISKMLIGQNLLSLGIFMYKNVNKSKNRIVKM